MRYVQDYSEQEQQRLIEQALYWQKDLILRNINYNNGESLLEIGCGVGGVLGIFGNQFPGLNLSGIDIEAKQISYGSQYLKNLGLEADLKIGDASKLPWSDNSFDHVYAIWFLREVSNPLGILEEAMRVLKPGGTITITEADYRSILITPESEDYNYLKHGLCELIIQSGGNPYIGQFLGNLLTQSKFTAVTNKAFIFHYFTGKSKKKMIEFIDHLNSWLAPAIPQIESYTGMDRESLKDGLEDLNSIKNNPNGSISAMIYRACGIKTFLQDFD